MRGSWETAAWRVLPWLRTREQLPRAVSLDIERWVFCDRMSVETAILRLGARRVLVAHPNGR